MRRRWICRTMVILGVLTALFAILVWARFGVANLFLPKRLVGEAVIVDRLFAGAAPGSAAGEQPDGPELALPLPLLLDGLQAKGASTWPFSLGLVGIGNGAAGRALGIPWRAVLTASGALAIRGQTANPTPDFHLLPARFLDQPVDLRIRLDWLRITALDPQRQRIRLAGVVQAGDGLGILVNEAIAESTWDWVQVPGGWRPQVRIAIKRLSATVPAAKTLRGVLESSLQRVLDRKLRKLVFTGPTPVGIEADLSVGAVPADHR